MLRPVSAGEAVAMAGVAVCIVLGKLLDVASIKIRGAVINGAVHLGGEGGVAVLQTHAMRFLLFRLLASVFVESRSVLLATVASRIARDMTSRVVRLAMSTAHAHDIKPTRLNKVVERGNKRVSKVVVKAVTVAIPVVCRMALVFREIYLMLDAKYFAPIAVTTSVYVGYTYGMLRIRAGGRGRINEADNAVARQIHESMTNASLVKAYGGEAVEAVRLWDRMRALWALILFDKGCVAMTNFGQRALFTALFAQVALQGLGDAWGGRTTVGNLSVLFSFVLSIDTSMRTLGELAKDMGVWLTDCVELLSLHDELERVHAECVAAGTASSLGPEAGDAMRVCVETCKGRGADGAGDEGLGEPAIEFEGVCFGYDQKTPVLRDMSFRVMRGERVGIVGRTGSGKSTILKLVLKLYGYEGSIRVHGAELRGLCPGAVRSRVASVLQDMGVFDETILYNVAYGSLGCAEHDVVRACKDAGLAGVMCVHGLHSRMEVLSGGEVQMVSLARCLVRDVPVLLLDEATSQLDAGAEQAVFEMLMGMGGKTVVMVLHDLRMAEHMDRVLVVDGGAVQEAGTHGELMGLRGLYWRMRTGAA